MSHQIYQKDVFTHNALSLEANITPKRLGTILLAVISFLIVVETSAFSQECVRRNPTVKLGPSSQSSFAGNKLNYDVSVTNNDSADCSSSTFVVMPTFPEDGFKHTPDCVRLTLLPEETGSRSVSVKAPSGTCVGPKTIRETAINESVPQFSESGQATFNVINIAPDCGRANPTIVITPVTRTGRAGTSLQYVVTVRNNDDLACGGSVFNISASLPENQLRQEGRNDFNLFIPAGRTAAQTVNIQSRFLASGTIPFIQTAINVGVPCFRASIPGVRQNGDDVLASRDCDDCLTNLRLDVFLCTTVPDIVGPCDDIKILEKSVECNKICH